MAEPVKLLMDAIQTSWFAASSLTSRFSTVKFDEKPTDTSKGFPYVVIERGSSNLDFTTDRNEYWEHEVTFVTYNSSQGGSETDADTIKSVFDSYSMSLLPSSGSVVSKRPGQVAYSQSDELVHSCRISYRFRTSFPRVA